MLYVATIAYVNGVSLIGVFSDVEQAKAAVEIAVGLTPPDNAGPVAGAEIQTVELDVMHSPEDTVGTYVYTKLDPTNN